uniref:phosphate ABC transporter ATP-binding protein n=1 Tax=Natrinema pallidum TaxID=69527 RepID=UPI000A03CAE0|nr:phosphate ABC transporter ATP-binding protein [Natrinema pallidum]
MTRNDTRKADDSDEQRTDGSGPAVSEPTTRPDATSDSLLDDSFDVTSGTLSADADPVIETRNLDVFYDGVQALQDVTIGIPENGVTALIGPSGCGKSTFLRCINRMNDLIDAARVEGELRFEGKNVYDDDVDPVALRRKIGMVFQSPNPFPKSIRDNVAFGLEVQDKAGDVDETVHRALERAALLDEVEDQLDSSGLDLSGGQQQRLCIARAIAPDPDVLLMDEPASALDPIATSKIEDLIEDLAEEYTVIIVTHNMQQAAPRSIRSRPRRSRT